ncbi:hypothetical protein [Rhizobium sp. GN54]|uniref:hypothetical protein n=1 Tax=Rhizobium sp. GN54 TaxID=2898150 RepID=UPI001E32478B|nr:hypothetical protein [Rhizobium sp. GN54]MCD2184557.1 hypothetical protein [Rhizobium sp. GN54]
METVTNAVDVATYGYVLGALVYVWERINGWALLVAILTPTLIIFGRQEIRVRRVRQIFDFERTFGQINSGEKSINPSFEFVRSKYLSDVDLDGGWEATSATLPTGMPLNELLNRIRRQGLRRDLRLFVSSIGLMIVVYLGFDALLAAIRCGFGDATCACSSTHFAGCTQPAALVAGEAAAGPDAAGAPGRVGFGNLVVVGALAFAGAYIGAVRNFLRNLAVYDLSSFTFLKQGCEIVAASVFAMIAFAALPDPFGVFTAPQTGIDATTHDGRISMVWIALAPILGLMPRSATQFVYTKTKNLVPWFKTEDDRFERVTRITPMDVIDGIDFPTRFRLEDCGIYDVQNLAAANPIMLHIESPFGIYQCIDWVAQAQLCHILGIEKFLMMRELNIRTIFDLERAIDASGEPDEADSIYAGILFAATDNLRAIAAIGSSRPIVIQDGKATPASIDEYCIWARTVIGTSQEQTKKCIEHVMRWIGDDLHVRRLRRIWNDISRSLGPGAIALDEARTGRAAGTDGERRGAGQSTGGTGGGAPEPGTQQPGGQPAAPTQDPASDPPSGADGEPGAGQQ